MRRLIIEDPKCMTCLHYHKDVCLLGNKESVCEDHCTEELFQLMGKHIPVVRHRILNLIQGGNCPICNKAPTSSALDHHRTKKVHGTGQIRGVLCRTCNIFIAKSENNAGRYLISSEELPHVLRRMADYLLKEQYPYVHPSEKAKPKYVRKDSYNKLKKECARIGYKKFIPDYPTDDKAKMKMTLPLKRAYEAVGMEPEYYKI